MISHTSANVLRELSALVGLVVPRAGDGCCRWD